MKFRVIERCREAYPVRLMCRCLNVSPSGYYAWLTRAPSDRAAANERLTKRIETIHAAHQGVVGSPRIWESLRFDGERCGRHRVARLMRAKGLRGVPGRRRSTPKPSGTRPDGVGNHLERDFTAQRPNEKWVTDITFIRTAERWLYLCPVIDLYHHVVVGWSMSHRQDRQLVMQAALRALWQRDASLPVVLHSDRGCQFTSTDYQRFLADHNVVSSMSAVGSCADNAAAEGFFGMLKRERVNRRRYRTVSEARTDLFDYIERFHNPRMRQRAANREATSATLIQPSA